MPGAVRRAKSTELLTGWITVRRPPRTHAAEQDLKELLAPLAADGPPDGLNISAAEARDAHWVRSELIGEVAYAELTGPRHLDIHRSECYGSKIVRPAVLFGMSMIRI